MHVDAGETPSARPTAVGHFRRLNAIDGNDDDMHLELFSNGRYVRCLMDETHRTAKAVGAYRVR